MKHLFVINPVAGKGSSVKYISQIHEFFKDKNDEYFIEVTEYEGHASEIVKRYCSKGSYRIYSIGGDGTLNEVLNGMADSDSSLAVIPSGTGNDFIKNIYNESVYDNILINTIAGEEKLIDIATVNGRYFINISSIGFDSEVTKNARRIKKNNIIPSTVAYVVSIFFTVFKFDSIDIDVEIDDESIKRKITLVAVANGKDYGGGMMVAPQAEICDNKFDICMVNHISKFRILKLFPKLIKGTHEEIEEVEFYRGNKVTIKSEREFIINIDGEIIEGKKAEFEIKNKGIKVVFPKS